jgi:flavin-dependent dehydrogenase
VLPTGEGIHTAMMGGQAAADICVSFWQPFVLLCCCYCCCVLPTGEGFHTAMMGGQAAADI